MTKNQPKPPSFPRPAQPQYAAETEHRDEGTSRGRRANAPMERFGLTRREREVMEHLARGLLYKEIAHLMNLSYGAVHKLQHKIFLKLQVTNRTEAAIKWRYPDATARAA